MGVTAEPVADALRKVVAALPAGEQRPGQVAMAEAVAAAIESEEHLIVQAGTGTGKSQAYLVPAILSGAHVVVATATKALQEQLVHRDLPFLREHLGVPFRFALLKGRSNYLCRAALADTVGISGQTSMLADAVDPDRLSRVVEWSATTSTGDRSDLPFMLSDTEWGRLSVGVGECPGAAKCAYGDVCFAEDARDAAATAEVVVVNTHLYGIHVATRRGVLPDHEVLIVDEAHALEDVAADTMGVTVGPSRLDALAKAMRGLFTPDHPVAAKVEAAGTRLRSVLDMLEGRVEPADGDLGVALVGCAQVAGEASAAARAVDAAGDAATRKERLLQIATNIAVDIAVLSEVDERRVVWVERGGVPSLRMAPVDVGEVLAERLLCRDGDGDDQGERGGSRNPTVVLTSATLAVGGSFEPIAHRLGLDRAGRPWRGLDVGSPFDYEQQALLYCAAHLPEPRAAGYEAAMLDELAALVQAAGGRTLALFTSRRAMQAAAVHLRSLDLPWPLLVQDELPRPVLQARFVDEEDSVLLATMGFWQGFDAPGRTCSLVVIDRLPFSRPDDPLAEARRAAATRAKQNAFAAVDLPAAAVLLAQGAGRLVRTATDHGVVAVLDKRLATASYRWTLVRSLPPMRRTKDIEEVKAFLSGLD